MIYPRPTSSTPDFEGFDEARRLMWCHETRAQLSSRLMHTRLIRTPGLIAIHINNQSEQTLLTGFDACGAQIGQESVLLNMPSCSLDITPEFDHDFTGMLIPPDTPLAAAADLLSPGWVVDVAALRAYDLIADRHKTQRAVFMAHMQDMIAKGSVRMRATDQQYEASQPISADRRDDDNSAAA